MYRQSNRTGYKNWELYDRVEKHERGLYRRRIVAVQDFDIPHTNQWVRKGTLGGYLECDADGNVYPIVSADSWVDYDSSVEAGALIDGSYLLNSSAGASHCGGGFIYSTTWHRKTYVIGSVVSNSQLFGDTLVNELHQDNQSRDSIEPDIEEVRKTDNFEKVAWTNHEVWSRRDELIAAGHDELAILDATKILDTLKEVLQ